MEKNVRDLQSLRLVTAYLKIQDMSIRETIISLAEAAASGAVFEVHHRVVEEEPPKSLN